MNSPFNFSKLGKPVNAPASPILGNILGNAKVANASVTNTIAATATSYLSSIISLSVAVAVIATVVYVYYYTNIYESLKQRFFPPEVVEYVPPPPPPPPIVAEEIPSGMPGARETPSIFTQMARKASMALDPSKQVFNISRNLYTYDEAAPLCKAMGAELATYDQIQDAHKKGADWCNYGWVKGQMAVFPTQEETWNKLQTGPAEYRSACGKPGVNGGAFDNPDLRFGVNCFGPRPDKKDTDELTTDTGFDVPRTAEQIEFDKKVQKFRDQLPNVTVLPWSRGTWSE